MKILFVVPYPPGRSPSQRFRFEQYFQFLEHQYHIEPFLDDAGWDVLYLKGRLLGKVAAVIRGFARRCLLMFRIPGYDVVFIHREAAPLGPPVFEWLIANAFRKKIIYDFDDAIWLTDRQNESWLARRLRWRGKVRSIIRWSDVVSCGNDYLRSYARSYNFNARYNPTTIDTAYHRPIELPKKNDEIVIGWTGSHSTLKYLDAIVPVIQELEQKYCNLVFMVIADQEPGIPVSSLRFVRWSEATEIHDLAKIDIGIMPLPDDEWSKGKCGFKALQYMSMQLPVVASPVSVNSKIVYDGINGFLCSGSSDWVVKLTRLIDDPGLRKKMGEAGRQTVEQHYSVTSNVSTFLSLFGLSASRTSASR